MSDTFVSDIQGPAFPEVHGADADGTRRARPVEHAHFLLGAVLGVSLFAPPTCGVSWPAMPGQDATACAPRAGAGIRRSLRGMAEDAVRRMTPDQRALYERILAARDGFGGSVDANALIREIREDADQMGV